MYIVRFLHQTTTVKSPKIYSITLYIVRFLHQTTTSATDDTLVNGCISSVSYIKPQLSSGQRKGLLVVYRPFPTSNHNFLLLVLSMLLVVYRPFPTSNHNRYADYKKDMLVVYRPFPTSNHNLWKNVDISKELYIVRFLHQTTTSGCLGWGVPKLYIVRFLHQTTTGGHLLLLCLRLYIVRFLHQTTTTAPSCELFAALYIVRFLHQTTTDRDFISLFNQLYIVRFLHQTTTLFLLTHWLLSCISSVSYIKPQLKLPFAFSAIVVYRPFPTSNHNARTLYLDST